LSVPDADILSAVRAQFHGALPERIGVALSGGGDSTALLHILHKCLEDTETTLCAATVNHGLREGAEAEARQAAVLCETLGIEHTLLYWRGWDMQGNLQAQARNARYRLLTDWAHSSGVTVLALGHTADDQAETLLMRMARMSGVTGLSGMPVRRTMEGVTLFRPLLQISRRMLRHYLEQHNIPWSEDPSNEDTRFERVRVRQAMAALEPLGLTPMALAQVADNVGKAREALDWYTFLAARDMVVVTAGSVMLDMRGFRTLPVEIARRLLVQTMNWISCAEYPPRRTAVSDALEAIRGGKSLTLHGCRIVCKATHAWICREYQAVRDTVSPVGTPWDNRWRVHGGDAVATEVRALGEAGLRLCPDWRDTGLPREVLMATPAVWRNDDLVAAPLAGLSNGWEAEPEIGHEEFFASLLSH
jgi:tRNA(Ile)-lysidine synthase